jgi:hypothetical protein
LRQSRALASYFASAVAYQPDYTLLRGQMDQLRKTAAEKNCNLSEGVSGVDSRPTGH